MHYHIKKQNETYYIKEKEYNPLYFLKTESIFSQCNGYIGVRASLDFKTVKENRGLFVGGVYHKAYDSEVTELVNCPDITEIQMTIDGAPFYLDRCDIRVFERSLNTETGELKIKYVCRTNDGLELEIESRRFASFEDKRLFCQEIRVKAVNRNIDSIRFTSGINGQKTNSGVSHFQSMDARVYDKTFMEMTGQLEKETLHIISGLAAAGGESVSTPEFSLGRRMLHGSYSYKMLQGENIILLKCSLIDSMDKKEDPNKKKQLLTDHLSAGYDDIYKKHCKAVKNLWKYAKIQIDGGLDREKAAIQFAQHHLLGMAPIDGADYSIGAKGLTGEGYKGHVFWDAELFLLPFFTYIFPETSRNLLKFRYHGLDGARKKAAEFGYAGAMFPWETGKDGMEETPMYAALNIHTGKANKIWSGLKEHHVSADIVYAIWQYYLLTGDKEFMRDYGCEVIFETACFWVSRAVLDEKTGKYHILDIIGPDEYTEHIDNNAYTNYMAAFCVKLAYRLMKRLKAEEESAYQRLDRELNLKKWEERWYAFAEAIYLPQPNEQGIIPQDDTFLNKKQIEDIQKYKTSLIKQSVLLDYSRDEVVDMQVLKQADTVMLLNLFPSLFAAEVVKKNVLFYEERTIHDSSLSYCAHAQACAFIGETGLATEFFHKAMDIDLNDNPHDTADGIHSASLGGLWNCLIFGFAGVSIQEEKLVINPKLPKHWNRMKFHLRVKDCLIEVEISHGRVWLKNKNKDIVLDAEIYGETCKLEDTIKVYRNEEYKKIV